MTLIIRDEGMRLFYESVEKDDIGGATFFYDESLPKVVLHAALRLAQKKGNAEMEEFLKVVIENHPITYADWGRLFPSKKSKKKTK